VNFYAILALTHDHYPLRQASVSVAVIALGVVIVSLWQRLPVRASAERSRFTRGELIGATLGVMLFAVTFVPDVVRHGLAVWQWVLVPFGRTPPKAR
jgi:hypothetical protein